MSGWTEEQIRKWLGTALVILCIFLLVCWYKNKKNSGARVMVDNYEEVDPYYYRDPYQEGLRITRNDREAALDNIHKMSMQVFRGPSQQSDKRVKSMHELDMPIINRDVAKSPDDYVDLRRNVDGMVGLDDLEASEARTAVDFDRKNLTLRGDIITPTPHQALILQDHNKGLSSDILYMTDLTPEFGPASGSITL